jgi:sporadic carbohydrate cluster 2OG-Fe(II) oxygenase
MNIEKNFIKHGFIKASVDKNILDYISNFIFSFLKKKLNYKKDDKIFFLNNFHNLINNIKLNEIRLEIINFLSSNPEFKIKIYLLVKKYLDEIVGNELVIQKTPNLVIQLPKDESAILDLHADTWGGNSPFEIVVWLPLVNCYKTKSMFLLDGNKNKKIINKIENEFKKGKSISAEKIFQRIKKNITWLDVNYGEVILFNPALPHGARKNLEKETRFSINCRFKGIFTPYGDKKIGEYFEPITLKPMSKLGLKYFNEKKI